MKSTSLLPVAALSLALISISFPALGVEPEWVGRSNKNAELMLQVMAKYSPETASQLGVDGFDEQILDLSRDQFEYQNTDVRAVIDELRKRSATEADARVKQDIEILIGTAEDQLRSGALNRKYFFPFIDLSS